MKNVIEIRNLKKAFGKTEIFKDVNLDLKRGENIAILGQSGTGKSVLIKCIVGWIMADSGVINVLGKNIHSLNNEGLNELRKNKHLFIGVENKVDK